MPLVPANASGVEIFYETHGDPEGEPLLLVMGLGGQLIAWEPDFVGGFVDRGFHVITFDNRDVGHSTKVERFDVDFMAEIVKGMTGEPVSAPYLLSDMAADAVGVLDHLGIDSAHVAGESMGGMISQTIAIEHPHRVRSLTSIMSTTGDLDVGMPDPSILGVFLAAPPADREGAIAAAVEVSRAIWSPVHFDEEVAVQRATDAYDRCNHPLGVTHQLLAIAASGSRSEALAALGVPALVIHGDLDLLITPSGGARTAEVIPGAELLTLDTMAHDRPPALWPAMIEAITRLAARAATAA